MPGSRFYIPQLDGLRFFAFLSVFLGHALYNVTELPTGCPAWYAWCGRSALMAGAFGVDLFFVLSSYLITVLLVREADATGRISVPAFWMRRVLRIWPLYFSFVVACALLGGISARMAAAMSVFAGNWAMAAWGDNAGVAGPLWSVSVEEQFYLTWPLVLATLPRRYLRLASVGLIVVAVAVRYALFSSGASVTSSWLNTVAHLDAIGIGALIALAPRVHLAPVARGALGAASALALVACAGVVWFELMRPLTPYIRSGDAGAATLAFLGVALACGGLLLAALAGGTLLSRPAFVYLGRISYGLYVFHATAIWLVFDWWWAYRAPVALALTVAAAAVSYRYLELPFLRLKARYTWDFRHAPVLASGLSPLGGAAASREL